MSMISSQIDELRELAGDGSMEWAGGPIRASVLRDAADTIWELRDDLQRANADNVKLRETLRRRTEHFNGMAEMWVERGVENTKLRDLVRDLLQPILADGFDCYGCVHEDCNGMQHTDRCKILDRARELGVNVES